MSNQKEIIITTNKFRKLIAVIAMLFIMVMIIYLKKYDDDKSLKLLIAYWLSFVFPFIAILTIISVILEIKRGYSIKISTYGIIIGLFSTCFTIPWDAINSIELQERTLWRWRYTKKHLKMNELVIVYNHEDRKFNRKLNIFDYIYNSVFPYLKGDLHISDKMIKNNSNKIINYYNDIRFYLHK